MSTNQVSTTPTSIAASSLNLAGVPAELIELCQAEEYAPLKAILEIYAGVIAERAS